MTTTTTPAARHMTPAERVAELGITLTALTSPEWRSEWNGEKWEHHAFRVQLRRTGGKTIATAWMQGTAHGTTPPSAEDVLDSLLSDARSWLNAPTLQDFAAEFGYDMGDPDEVRRTRKIYTALGKLAPRVIAWLGGEEAFETVSYFTDSL